LSTKINFQKLSWFILGLAFVVILLRACLLPHGGVVFPVSEMDIQHSDGSKVHFKIEVATTPEQQEHGLMFRKSLAERAGMLFLWPEDQPVSMWMKNTLIPLDMLYIDRSGVITQIVVNAKPEDLTPLVSNGPIRAVLEIGGGEVGRQNIKTGEKVLFSGFPP
jgi:uncharacterized membrane protein (UPF0127 family)